MSRRAVVLAASALLALTGASVATAAPVLPAPANHWPLDETSGSEARDVIAGRVVSLHNGASFGQGRQGNAVWFDGADDQAVGDQVDFRTDQAFSVSAWVNLTEKNFGKVTAVSVDGLRTSKIQLGHVVDDDNSQFGAWTFSGPESDSDQATTTKVATSTLPSEVGTWTHLVGVYDPAAGKVWLYVNGMRVGDGTLGTPWQATGGVRIGAAKAAGAPVRFWPGGVDDVRFFPRALDRAEVSALYKG
ncbi:LamG domain-containing protein [Amycolatopsis sp. NPDC049868]|uniref:LamG domain-containing protein n=1 Tax=Amycolatopsis sp. NPDC049868 TaxID=3363934 RepID=UPI00379C306F